MGLQQYEFELKNCLSELNVLNQHLNNWGGNIGLQDISIARINICLDELLTNIISYGFDDNLDHVIGFMLNYDNNCVIINIEDDGKPFNPLEKIDPDFPDNVESAKIGGLGIHIIRKIMDSVSYERIQCKNMLTMKKISRTCDKAGKAQKIKSVPSR